MKKTDMPSLANQRNYHYFACKLQKILSQAKELTPAKAQELVEGLTNTCALLEFSLSDGERFAQRYPGATATAENLQQVLPQVTELRLLGGALYSKCYYFQTWAASSQEFLAPANLQWVQLLLARFQELAAAGLDFFVGDLVSLKLVSNSQRFGPVPQPGTEFEQQLSLTQNGNGTYHVLTVDQHGQEQISRSQKIRLKPAKAQGILKRFENYFRLGYETEFATDIGQWNLCLKNSQGEKFYLIRKGRSSRRGRQIWCPWCFCDPFQATR